MLFDTLINNILYIYEYLHSSRHRYTLNVQVLFSDTLKQNSGLTYRFYAIIDMEESVCTNTNLQHAAHITSGIF